MAICLPFSRVSITIGPGELGVCWVRHMINIVSKSYIPLWPKVLCVANILHSSHPPQFIKYDNVIMDIYVFGYVRAICTVSSKLFDDRYGMTKCSFSYFYIVTI